MYVNSNFFFAHPADSHHYGHKTAVPRVFTMTGVDCIGYLSCWSYIVLIYEGWSLHMGAEHVLLQLLYMSFSGLCVEEFHCVSIYILLISHSFFLAFFYLCYTDSCRVYFNFFFLFFFSIIPPHFRVWTLITGGFTEYRIWNVSACFQPNHSI